MLAIVPLAAMQILRSINLNSLEESGWLYLGDKPRLVRFEVNSISPGDPAVFFPAPQRTGYIVLSGETYTISVAESFGSALLEFKNGVLEERCTTSSEGNLGSFLPRTEKGLTFEHAFSKAMGEIADEALAEFCREMLQSKQARDDRRLVAKIKSLDESTTITLGASRGALISFSHTEGMSRASGIAKRITCNFNVMVSARPNRE